MSKKSRKRRRKKGRNDDSVSLSNSSVIVFAVLCAVILFQITTSTSAVSSVVDYTAQRQEPALAFESQASLQRPVDPSATDTQQSIPQKAEVATIVCPGIQQMKFGVGPLKLQGADQIDFECLKMLVAGGNLEAQDFMSRLLRCDLNANYVPAGGIKNCLRLISPNVTEEEMERAIVYAESVHVPMEIKFCDRSPHDRKVLRAIQSGVRAVRFCFLK